MRFWCALSMMFLCWLADAKSQVVEKITSPRRTPSTGVIIHKQTEHFIDLEVPVKRIWIGCIYADSKEGASLLAINVEDKDIHYSFYPRRAIHDATTCLAEEERNRKLLKGVKTARVVGEFSGLQLTSQKIYPKDRTPHRFKSKPFTGGGFFIRLQAGSSCVSYFANGCDLPKNYWAGATPVD